jgi:GntR family transcriptional regulator, transcriptional repressor for pyruvate dehydrogenase complex
LQQGGRTGANVAAGDNRQVLVKALLTRVDEARATASMRLPGERDLANRYGASRTAVREVLGVFDALRLIERRPQSGIYVRNVDTDASIDALVLRETLDVRPSADAYEQAQEARVILEVEGARLAAERRTALDLEVIRGLIDKSRVTARKGANLADDDEAFHLAMLSSAKNPVLSRIATSLYLITRSVRITYFNLPGAARSSIVEHERILQAIASKDAARAEHLVRKHYSRSSNRWRKIIV